MEPEYNQQASFYISTDRLLLNLDFTFNYLSLKSYWAKNIHRYKFLTAIENSICFGINKQNDQVGFARVITDKATFDYVCDVFVEEKYIGLGLSNKLMEATIAFPELQGLGRWTLATGNAHELHNSMGLNL